MRGKDDRPCAYDHTDRITPAYAGKSGWFQRRLQHGGGSPPRMRGRGLCFPALCKLLGITPAYAGKSWRGQLCPWAFQDHPRVCGEKLFPFAFRRILGGSPPRVRGKGGIIRYNNFVHRITPACAGKSERFWSRKDTLEDHPRVCGEKRLEIISMHLVKGSPPRVRGKAASADVGFRNLGITPACAGKRRR